LKKSGKLDEARRMLEMVVVFDREDALAWNNLGMVYAELHDFPQSISALQQSLALEKNAQILLNLARIYEEANDFKSSQETLGRYLETFAPQDGLKATLKSRMRLLGSLAYLQSSSEPPSSAAPTISTPPTASALRGPASRGGK
jgi:tetratricopeptide (TPR) repeat protein